MITATVIAVALGLTPVDSARPSQVVTGDYDAMVGRYSETVDRRGTIHVHGLHPSNRAPYDVTITRGGEVEASVGDAIVSFRVQPAQ